jgi:hypothetical protein
VSVRHHETLRDPHNDFLQMKVFVGLQKKILFVPDETALSNLTQTLLEKKRSLLCEEQRMSLYEAQHEIPHERVGSVVYENQNETMKIVFAENLGSFEALKMIYCP